MGNIFLSNSQTEQMSLELEVEIEVPEVEVEVEVEAEVEVEVEVEIEAPEVEIEVEVEVPEVEVAFEVEIEVPEVEIEIEIEAPELEIEVEIEVPDVEVGMNVEVDLNAPLTLEVGGGVDDSILCFPGLVHIHDGNCRLLSFLSLGYRRESLLVRLGHFRCDRCLQCWWNYLLFLLRWKEKYCRHQS